MKALTPIVALALIVGTAGRAQAEDLWVFGDSLSDTGNLSLLFNTDDNPDTYLPAAYTPYSPVPGITLQRISNGKTTIEYVADHYGETLLPSFLQPYVGDQDANNFAIFGARASLTSGLDLPYQVAQLAERVMLRDLDVSGDRAVVAIGSNDVFAAWSAAIAPLQTGGSIDMEAGRVIVDEAVASLETFVFSGGYQTIPSPEGDGTVNLPSLAGLGIEKFLVLNSPDIGSTPWVTQTATALGEDQVVHVAKKLTRRFNRKLRNLVHEMRHGGLDVASVNLYQVAKIVRFQHRWFGFTNTDDPCFLTNTLATLQQGVPPTPGVYAPDCSAELANDFMFLDTAHPTASVHALTGERVVHRLQWQSCGE